MKITYFALKEIQVGEHTAYPGDLVPEAETWPYVHAYVRDGKIAPTLVSTLPQADQERLRRWVPGNEYTGNPANERGTAMARTPEEEEAIRQDTLDNVPDPEAQAAVEEEVAEARRKAAEAKGEPPEPAEVITADQEVKSLEESVEDSGSLMAVSAEEFLKDDDSDDEEDDEEGEDSYDAYTVAELKAELDTREIEYPASAKKADLVALLEEDDAE